MYSPTSSLLTSQNKTNINSKRQRPSLLISNKQINSQKPQNNNPELESAMFLAKANLSARTVVYSPVENKIKSLKRNIYLKTEEENPFNQKIPGTILTNPNISEDIKNKYNEVFSETLTNKPAINKPSTYAPVNTLPNSNTVLSKATKQYGFDLNSDNKYNKKKEIYLLLTNGDTATCKCKNEEEINQKFRELSSDRHHFVRPTSKILIAKKQLGKIINSVNNKNYYNTFNKKDERVMLFSPGSIIQKHHNNVNGKNEKDKCDSHRLRMNFASPFTKNVSSLNTVDYANNYKVNNINKDKGTNFHGRCLTFL